MCFLIIQHKLYYKTNIIISVIGFSTKYLKITNTNSMTRKFLSPLPFVIIPLLIPIYIILDSRIFVKVFGCGCVPIAQTNMLNIAFNANDLRTTVFMILTAILTMFGCYISKGFQKKRHKNILLSFGFRI